MAKGIQIKGSVVKELRGQLFLSQVELAQKIGISISGIQRMERAKSTSIVHGNFRALAELAGVEPSEFQKRMNV